MPRRPGLTDEERKRKAAERQRRYYEKNREKCIATSLASRAKKPEEHKAVQAAYRERNKERIKAQQIGYREANRDRLNASSRQWQLDNPEKFAAYQNSYREANRARETARANAWRIAHPGRQAEYARKWAKENMERRRLAQANRRGRISAHPGTLSGDIVDRLMRLQRGKCVACRCDLRASGHHIDHIIPLARGGEHCDRNVQLLCPTCNLAKHAKHPVAFMQEKGFLL